MEKKLNQNHLKLIAIIAMTIDHFNDLVYPRYPAEPLPIFLHIIGRLTAPIMWFFIAEGYHYTSNVKKYMARLFIFAIISHFAYTFAFGISFIPFQDGIFNQTSVMYPLFVAVLILWIQDTEFENLKGWKKDLLVFILIWTAFPANWSCIAVLAIMEIHKHRGNLEKQMFHLMIWVLVYAAVSFVFLSKTFALIQPFVILVYPLMKMYNGQRGKVKFQMIQHLKLTKNVLEISKDGILISIRIQEKLLRHHQLMPSLGTIRLFM